jgi:hypothetical protein
MARKQNSNPKKAREKQKKHVDFLVSLGREKSLELYTLMEEVLQARSEKRALWHERAKSKVRCAVPSCAEPILA